MEACRYILQYCFIGVLITSVLVSSAPLISDSNAGSYSVTVNTTQRLANLRALFQHYSINAYIVPSQDAHQSEYIADCHKRREFISGASGTAGIAVVTEDKAALWTDGRYWEQAEMQLDSNWILMKDGQPEVPSMFEWLKSELSEGETVAVDPTLLSSTVFFDWSHQLGDVVLKPVEVNLIDVVWVDRPPCSNASLQVLGLEHAGIKWQEKMEDLRATLTDSSVDGIVLSTLDEIAWLLNLRGRDIPYNPVFFSHAVITLTEAHLFVDAVKITPEVEQHLNANACENEVGVCLHAYEDFGIFLEAQNWHKVWLPSQYSYSGGVSYDTYSKVEEDKIIMKSSPVIYMKEQKNAVERQGMRKAHIKDAVALIAFMALLEEEVSSGIEWTELSASEELRRYRCVQEGFTGNSFETIVGYGSNGAMAHYVPTPETNKRISSDSLLLLDSGGQYLDGTTDVTRTFHFGDPTNYQKEMYTRVLKGVIELALLEVPKGTLDEYLDIISRLSLYKAGKNFHHGIAHGVGAHLNVHESSSLRVTEHFFGSHEPGFYESGHFGIRIENIVEVVFKQSTEYGVFLGFNTTTLVPLEPKLIKTDLLTFEEIAWLNDYNKKIRDIMGPKLLEVDDGRRALNWMLSRTEEINTE